MQQENRWLEQVLSISVDTPYDSYLDSGDDSETENDPLTIVGTTLFQLDNGDLTFRFFAKERGRDMDLAKALARRSMILRVPDQDFAHPVKITGESLHSVALKGHVTSESFGANDTLLSGTIIWLVGLPGGWRGTDRWAHYEVISSEKVQIQLDGTVLLPNGSKSFRALSGFTLKADGWTARLREIPNSQRTDPAITHMCHVTNENGLLSAKTAQEFLETDLFTFLNFVFGQKIGLTMITGYKDGTIEWVRTFPQIETSTKTLQSNWFLQTMRSPIDLSPLFHRFYSLSPEVKNHWRKVIDQYASSEEVMGTLRNSSLAASISFAALDGLVRSMISTYPCKDEWLKDDLSLKRGKSINRAIELVAKQELGRHGKTLEGAAEQIFQIRNETFHTDLGSDEDPVNAYYRWNASQALVEILLLGRMGLEEIPNRTAFGKFKILGMDMFEDVRKEELTFE